MILDPGAVFTGTVVGGGTNTTLELAQGSGPGTLAALGTTFLNFGSVVVDPGATWTVEALASALAGVAITGSGGSDMLEMISAGTFSLGGVSNFPTIDLAAGNNTVTMTDNTLSRESVTLNDGASGSNTISVDDTAASKGKTLTYVTGTGSDTFIGGFENDTVDVSAAAVNGDTLTGGRGTNTLVLTSPGTFSLGGVSNFSTIELAPGNNTVTVTDNTLSGGTIEVGASGNETINVVDTAASRGKTLTYVAGTGADKFTGGFENDTIYVSAAALAGDALVGGSGTNMLVLTSAGTINLGPISTFTTIDFAAGTNRVLGSAAEVSTDTLNGGSGTNTLVLTTAGTVNLGGVSGFATIDLAAGGNNTVTVTDPSFPPGGTLTLFGGAGNNTVLVEDTAASKGKTLIYFAGSGSDVFTGGFENDKLFVSAAAVAGDLLTGGSGANTLGLTSAGTVNLGGVSGFATINLAVGNSTVTVTDHTLSGGTVTLFDGASGNNTVSAATDTAASKGKTLSYFTGQEATASPAAQRTTSCSCRRVRLAPTR